MIEAPVPLLVGITKKEYRELSLSEEERMSKAWVFLENGQVIWNEVQVPHFSFGGGQLEKIIKSSYLEFENTTANTSIYTRESHDSMVESARSSLVSVANVSYIYNDK